MTAQRQRSPRQQNSISFNAPYRPSPGVPPAAQKPSPSYQPIRFNTAIPSIESNVKSPQSAQFSLVVPLTQDGVRTSQPGIGPVPYRIDPKKEKQSLLEELKKSIEPVKTRLHEVEKYFGQTGFSEAFRTDEDVIRLQNAASIKRKKKRKGLKLDWGAQPPVAEPDSVSNSDILVHPTQQVKQLLTDRFQELHDPPLTFANDVNDRRLNGKFQFVDRYIFCQGVRTANPNQNYGCSCTGLCEPTACQCSLHSHDIRSQSLNTLDSIVTYIRRPDGLVVLSDQYMLNELTPAAHHFEISECNENCSCGPDCFNRVVGRGRTVPLEVFETEKCGFGVRSAVEIVKGQFIDLYLGEVITQSELERREAAKEETASSYIYSLDWFSEQYCYHVDGENFGTAMRFVNHNCSPNARNFTVRSHNVDKHVYYLAFFAIKDIPAGTEICIDYSPQEAGKYVESSSRVTGGGDDETDAADDDEDESRARCYCGAQNCRRFLWRTAGRKRKKRKTTKHD